MEHKHDYEKLGLKAGLEVHQQLDTGKLFIRTQSTLTEETDFVVERKLRPVPSELGEYDKTALDAFKRNETFCYSGKRENISLVELDEEPPQPLDKEALRTALEITLLCNSKPVSKAVPMRKTVIDGSNTSAFQRTMLLSLGGHFLIKTPHENEKEKRIGVQTIILEEDAARPIKREQGKAQYNLDRLGIPLIELATDPDIRTPEEAITTAAKIGEIMRLTSKVKRGKGTIRQDVNVSIAQGARCEIKGCQELEQIGALVEKEVERQLDLLALGKKLKHAYAKQLERAGEDKQKISSQLFIEPKEVTKAFDGTACKFIKEKSVWGIKISGAKGFLGEKVGEKRFGSELSAYAKATGVSGLLHRDEMPAYGIIQKEIDSICYLLGCSAEDNFVLIVAPEGSAHKGFEAIRERFLFAFNGVPSETRGALEDASSEYQRPLSGEARMYPETDLLPEIITDKMLKEIKRSLPLSVESRIGLYTQWGLSTNHVEEMKLSNYARFFETCVEKGANAKVTASLLLQTLTELKREKIEVEKIKLAQIEELLLSEAQGQINKNNLALALTEIAKGATVEEVLSAKKSVEVDSEAVRKKIAEIVSQNLPLVQGKGMGAMGPLMGDIMKIPELKMVDGKLLSELLKKEILAQK